MEPCKGSLPLRIRFLLDRSALAMCRIASPDETWSRHSHTLCFTSHPPVSEPHSPCQRLSVGVLADSQGQHTTGVRHYKAETLTTTHGASEPRTEQMGLIIWVVACISMHGHDRNHTFRRRRNLCKSPVVVAIIGSLCQRFRRPCERPDDRDNSTIDTDAHEYLPNRSA